MLSFLIALNLWRISILLEISFVKMKIINKRSVFLLCLDILRIIFVKQVLSLAPKLKILDSDLLNPEAKKKKQIARKKARQALDRKNKEKLTPKDTEQATFESHKSKPKEGDKAEKKKEFTFEGEKDKKRKRGDDPRSDVPQKKSILHKKQISRPKRTN
eukprot:TRINITY_DN651_c0_g1_i1.p1 TRINITY_DN651_c0_g1~~TRINITY_DN651_c0_g1_i1.p1  ORF type:complete len:159 (-),score=37.74 TRINITY_DN651_c0_g1_i1:173-649(-)